MRAISDWQQLGFLFPKNRATSFIISEDITPIDQLKFIFEYWLLTFKRRTFMLYVCVSVVSKELELVFVRPFIIGFDVYNLIRRMVQVIHNYLGSYPFNCKKESGNTFMQLSKCDLSEEEIHLQRQKAKIYKNIDNPHFIKLIKTLKEDSKLHFIYQYEQTSLQGYIQTLRKSIEGPLSKEKYKSIVTDFKNNIDNIIDILIKQQIKADVFLSSVACTLKHQKDGTFLLKAFIDPDAEYLSLIQHHYRPKDTKKKDKTALNQEFLTQFYEAERKRLMLEFEQILERSFGKQETTQKKQFPNFVINGTKLVFINSEEKEKESCTEQSEKKVHEIPRINQIKETYIKEKEKNGEPREKNNDSKDRIPSKMQQSKTTGASEGSRNCSPALQKQIIKSHQVKEEKEIRPTSPIIDFDQSFQPEFKPQEFLRQKTYIYEEEKDYLQSLEDEINKMAVEKHAQQSKKQLKSEKQVTKQTQKPQRNKLSAGEGQKVNEKMERKEHTPTKQKDLTTSQGSTQNNTYHFSGNPQTSNSKNNQSASLSNHSHSNNNLSNENISNNDSYEKKPEVKETKAEKVNKYKMKIITSHQIEIEGGSDEPNVQEIEKEIIEGIRTGKININQLAAEKNPKITLVSRSENQDKEKSAHQPTMYSSDHRDHAHSKDSNEPQKKGKVRHDSDGGEANNIKTKEIQMSKMKNISQILEKIGVKSNPNPHPPKEEEPESYQPKGITKPETTKPETAKVQQNLKLQTAASTPQNRSQKLETVEKIEKIEKTEKNEKHPKVENDLSDEKIQKTENYLNKIREAKNKAEQILRQYTKKKQ